MTATTTTTQNPAATAPARARLRPARSVIPYATLALMYVATVLIAPGYLQAAQIGNLLQLAAILGVAAIGQTLVILIGGIDLSVGATMTLANLVAATMIAGNNSAIVPAVLTCVAVGAFIGLLNALAITRLRVPDLVATLAMTGIVTGVGYLLTGGAPRGTSAPALNALMTSRFAGVLTGGVLLLLVLAVVVHVVLTRTAFGRRVYAVGLNREASRYAAVPVTGTVTALYVSAGVTASLAGVMLTGYLGSSYLDSGSSYQMATIAAVVLGGASIFGGSGSYVGTLAGVGITVLLLSILQVLGIPEAGQTIVYGVVILLMLIAFTPRRPTR